MRNVMTYVLTLLLLFSLVPAISANQTDDLSGHVLEHDMRAMIEHNVIAGYRENVYAPDDAVTRAQFATFIARALYLPSGQASFADVPDHYILADGIKRAAVAGIVSGYPGNQFKPNQKITREQMAVMIDRALAYQDIERTPVHLSFVDTAEIAPSFRSSVAHNVYFGIIQGSPTRDGKYRFSPKQAATRGHAAAFINRMLNVVATAGDQVTSYRLVTINPKGHVNFGTKHFMTFADADGQRTSNQAIYQGQQVVKMNQGIVVTTPPEGRFITTIYEEDLRKQITYVTSGVEMNYLDADEDKVKVQIADQVGYVKQTEVMLVPSLLVNEQSHYRNVGNELVHYIYNPLTNEYASYTIGVAPSFLQPNQRYYSWNGRDFHNQANEWVGTAEQYFNSLHLRSKTDYNAEQLNSYIEYVIATNPKIDDSPLKELGHVFKQAEEIYNVNALYLFAKAIHEGYYGLSEIAQAKYNLFGLRATDSDPMRNAESFESFEESILHIADYVTRRYMSPKPEGWYNHGAFLGNKGGGLNVNYASDPYWGQKIAGHMYRADKFLSQLDNKQ